MILYSEVHIFTTQMVREFILETELKQMEVEFAAVIRPACDVPLYLKDRH